jgi:hypothetical protein
MQKTTHCAGRVRVTRAVRMKGGVPLGVGLDLALPFVHDLVLEWGLWWSDERHIAGPSRLEPMHPQLMARP